jgi:CO/xanthine dehydrogenase FAD-binding subunit
MAAVAPGTADVIIPSSPAEAVRAFGDGSGVTVVAGGTIVLPEITAGKLRPGRAILLARAGLDTIERDGGSWRIGATVTVTRLAEQGPEPLREFASHVADYEVRAQATLGGNLCAPPGATPRGDLQVALLALDARVRTAGAGGDALEPVEDFLTGPFDGKLVLGVEVDEPRRAAAQGLGRAHTHSYDILSVAAAETAGGIRVAVGGAGPRALRCTSVEDEFSASRDAQAAAQRVLDDVEPHDDPLASAWYRRRLLPVLVARALNDL